MGELTEARSAKEEDYHGWCGGWFEEVDEFLFFWKGVR